MTFKKQFSEGGRLLESERAFRSIENGSLAIVLRSNLGIVMVAQVDHHSPSGLAAKELPTKIFKINESVGMVAVGSMPDGKVIVDLARKIANDYRLKYGEISSVEYLAKEISKEIQSKNQHDNTRDIMTQLIFAGTDHDGTRIYTILPSGACNSYNAIASGHLSGDVMDHLKANHEKNMSIDAMKELAFKTLQLHVECLLHPKNVELASITIDSKKLEFAGTEEKTRFIFKEIIFRIQENINVVNRYGNIIDLAESRDMIRIAENVSNIYEEFLLIKNEIENENNTNVDDILKDATEKFEEYRNLLMEKISKKMDDVSAENKKLLEKERQYVKSNEKKYIIIEQLNIKKIKKEYDKIEKLTKQLESVKNFSIMIEPLVRIFIDNNKINEQDLASLEDLYNRVQFKLKLLLEMVKEASRQVNETWMKLLK